MKLDTTKKFQTWNSWFQALPLISVSFRLWVELSPLSPKDMFLSKTPRTCECDLIWKRVFAGEAMGVGPNPV